MLRGKHADCALPRNFGGIGPGRHAEFANLQASGQTDLANEIGESFDHRCTVAQHQFSEDSRRHALPIKKGDAEVLLQVLEAAVKAGWDTPSAAAARPKCRLVARALTSSN
jgi:hypothetical protein